MSRESIILYRTEGGREPFTDWINGLRDKSGALRIRARIVRMEDGNLGDHKSVGAGVFELRLHFGPGYRVYFGQDGDSLVILLCGGDKATQDRDIDRAKAYWADWNDR